MAYADKFPTSMKTGGMKKKMKKGGFPDLTGDGKVTRADVLKGRGVFKSGGSKGLPKKQLGGVMRAIEKKPLPKIGGRTTTGVVNDYKGYKAPVSKKQVHLIKKQKGGGFPEEYIREINKTGVPGSKEYDNYLKKQGKLPISIPTPASPKRKPMTKRKFAKVTKKLMQSYKSTGAKKTSPYSTK